MVRSISSFVMFPLSGKYIRPLLPLPLQHPLSNRWYVRVAAFPLNSGFNNSAQELIGLPIKSGLIPKVSAL